MHLLLFYKTCDNVLFILIYMFKNFYYDIFIIQKEIHNDSYD
jgi:hypothetical protein